MSLVTIPTDKLRPYTRYCEAYLPRYMVGGRQAEYKLRRVDRREDDMVMRVGNSLVRRRTDKEDKRTVSLRELIRRCQGLAES